MLRLEMTTDAEPQLIARSSELERLAELAAAAGAGRGALVLVSGEAGAGKTALARAALARTGFRVVEAAAVETPGQPYAPVAVALRACARDDRRAPLADRSELRAALACVLPELAPGPRPHQPDVIFEAVAAALVEVAEAEPLGVLVDDLQWSDEATLDLMRYLAGVAERSPMLLIGTYRSDAIPRTHPIRRLRAELRRAGRLRELAVEPLSALETGRLLERLLGRPADPALAAAVHERTEGIPFFVEEVAAVLVETGRLQGGEGGLMLGGDVRLPLPESVRDAILVRASTLPDSVREALGIGSVAGPEFDLDTVAALGRGVEGLDHLDDCGLVTESGPGRYAFRHALVRDALYADLSWSRRQALHRAMAERLEGERAASSAVAAHWLVVGERERARVALLAAADASWAASACRDAAAELSRALDLWPPGVDAPGRLHALDRLGSCAELFGDAALAARAWTEAAEELEATGQPRRYAEVQRRLANALDLQGGWERSLAANQAAAAAFASCGDLAEAAAARLAAASRLRAGGSFPGALDLLRVAEGEAERAGRDDLRSRIWALEGNVLVRMGEEERGVRRVRSALELALSGNHAGAAAEAYVRLADSVEHTGDYLGARTAYVEASGFCRANHLADTEDVCLACLTMVLRQLGEWERALELCAAVLASPASATHPRSAASGVMGSIHAYQGRASRARPLLQSAVILARQIPLVAMELDAGCSLARLDDAAGRHGAALERCQDIVRRWKRTAHERHYSVPVFRWMATFGAEHGHPELVRACASALAEIASGPSAEALALAALAHALGEEAMLAGDAAAAAEQFERALATSGDLDLPFEHAEIGRRAGLALMRAGRRKEGLDHLVAAHRAARRLGARPLALRIAEETAALGERVERRLGRLAAAGAGRGGLTRREVEVARLVARGQISREIARDLHLSPRTVEVHVHNILGKLDCRTRVDIARRVAELGLLD
jgi:DNA-binding CsgD family transcriptional regulator